MQVKYHHKRLTVIRAYFGMNKREFGKAMNLHPRTVDHIEKGRVVPKHTTWNKICQALSVGHIVFQAEKAQFEFNGSAINVTITLPNGDAVMHQETITKPINK